jgi:phosphoribosylamine--glycine ligase
LKILVVGGGARESTLVWKLAQSPRATEVLAAPGNAGTSRIARNLDIQDTDIDSLLGAVRRERVDLVVIGPEAPLAAGLADHVAEIGVPVFGPSQRAAEIESSKTFAKDLMQRHGIPCAAGVAFTDHAEAVRYVERQVPPIWIKADGLAAGKGAVVADSVPQAQEILSSFLQSRSLGASGDTVVIEECLVGREMSCFVFSDGETVTPMAYACDYKRAHDGDQGLNTGGMGSYTPPWFLDAALAGRVQDEIMRPVVRALAQEGRPYRGILYGGIMVTAYGPRVIEFNARMGDPEAQVVMPLLKTDLVDIIMAVIEGRLSGTDVEMLPDACVGVVLASGGYPGSYRTGLPITGLDDIDEDVRVFHAATKTGEGPDEVLTSGGRVLTVAATGGTLAEARARAYDNISRIKFEDCYYRTDIALVGEQERGRDGK